MSEFRKFHIGDLWLVKKLPPLLFVYTEDGWILHEGDLLHLAWIIEQARDEKLLSLIESNKLPPNARRYTGECND